MAGLWYQSSFVKTENVKIVVYQGFIQTVKKNFLFWFYGFSGMLIWF